MRTTSFVVSAACIAFFAQACMIDPLNGESLASTSSSTRFAGYWTAPGIAIELQSAGTASGTFTTFASATSSRLATNVNGTPLYAWSVTAVVPGWTRGGCGSQVFVRARSSSVNLATFDELDCLLDALGDGQTVFNATLACSSPDSPVVRLTSGGSGGGGTYSGDVTVATQAEADVYACYATIDGSLTLADNPAALSIAMPNLTAVTGDLSIAYSREPIASNSPDVRSVLLPALTTVGGNVSLTYPGLGSDLVSFDMGLEALSSVGGDVSAFFQTFNATPSGLDVLTHIPGNLSIVSDGSDFTMWNLLPALETVDGDVAVENGYTLLGALEGLVSVGGELRVTDSYLTPGSSCFESVTSVGGDLVLGSLAGLITIDSFGPQLPSLTAVGGTLDIEAANGFTALDLVGSSSGLALGGLRLDGNGSLADVTAPLTAVDSSGPIAITDNASLCASNAQAFVAAQTAAGWAGVATVSGNMACP